MHMEREDGRTKPDPESKGEQPQLQGPHEKEDAAQKSRLVISSGNSVQYWRRASSISTTTFTETQWQSGEMTQGMKRTKTEKEGRQEKKDQS